jgi:shikimate dehydrogenase
MENARVYLHNRSFEKAQELSDEVLRRLGVKVEAVEEIEDAIHHADVLVNATSVGLHPRGFHTPVDKELLFPTLNVVDIIYNPLETQLIKDAKELGCETVNGVGMLVHQGAEALKIWLGIKPPVEAMRQAVLDSLKAQD